jgi:hypothetical protein
MNALLIRRRQPAALIGGAGDGACGFGLVSRTPRGASDPTLGTMSDHTSGHGVVACDTHTFADRQIAQRSNGEDAQGPSKTD